MNSSRIFLIGSLVLATGLSACSKGEKLPEERRPKQDSVRYAGKLQVRILPEIPTATDDLQVVFTGSGDPKYRWNKNGQVIAGEQGPRLAKKWFSRGDSIVAVILANGEEGSASLTIENASPRVTSVVVSPENFCRGVDITATPAGFDADGDPIRYSFKWLINGQELPEDTPVLKGDRINSGEKVSLKVTPHDDYGAGSEYVTQEFTVPSALPHFVSTPPTKFNGTTYIYEAKAEDPDGDTIRYSLVSAPPGMTINSSTGRLEWKVAKQSRSYDIEIEAKGNNGLSAYQKYTLVINIL